MITATKTTLQNQRKKTNNLTLISTPLMIIAYLQERTCILHYSDLSLRKMTNSDLNNSEFVSPPNVHFPLLEYYARL